MISVTKLRNGVCFEENGTPYKVTDYQHTHLSRGGGTIRVKVRSMSDGSVLTKTYKSGDKVEEIDIVKKKLQYLYREQDSYFFMNPVSFEQIEVGKKVIGDMGIFLKDGEEVSVLTWDDKFLDLDLPPKVTMEVIEADPGEKGDSASNVYKNAVVEGNHTIRVPLFINKGDKVRVDTRTGQYVERAS